MGLLSSIIGIAVCDVDRFRNQLSMSNAITAQLVSHDLPGFAAMTAQQPSEEAFCSSAISLRLKVDVHNFTILVHGSPQVVLLAADLYEYLINIERVAIALVPALQPSGVDCATLDAP